ncbi:hypothetical protein B0H19DRAFT_1266966 [Mycena capillaripes]|nr:hypothetical protein B0H19DRAFT_1266966 [Mycena capillaripes]
MLTSTRARSLVTPRVGSQFQGIIRRIDGPSIAHGKLAHEQDSYSFEAWAEQALGPLVGPSPIPSIYPAFIIRKLCSGTELFLQILPQICCSNPEPAICGNKSRATQNFLPKTVLATLRERIQFPKQSPIPVPSHPPPPRSRPPLCAPPPPSHPRDAFVCARVAPPSRLPTPRRSHHNDDPLHLPAAAPLRAASLSTLLLRHLAPPAPHVSDPSLIHAAAPLRPALVQRRHALHPPSPLLPLRLLPPTIASPALGYYT